MQTHNAKRIGSLVTPRLLEAYFCDELRCRFLIAGAYLHPHEVFDLAGCTTLFAQLADKRSRELFGAPIIERIEDDGKALLGQRVVLVGELSALQMPVLIQAAEEIFSIDCSDVTPRDIDLHPVIEYFNLTPEERKRTRCPWKPLKLLS